MKTISILLLFSTIFYCCTSTHLLMQTQSAYDDLNEELKGEKGQIILSNDDVISGENIIVGTDSTSWISSEISEDSIKGIHRQQVEQYISTSEIKNIVYENNTKGAYDGFGFGAIGGLIPSAIIVARILGSTPGGGYLELTPLEVGVSKGLYILAAIIGCPLAGGIIGAPIGAFIGHKEKYVPTKNIVIVADAIKKRSDDFITFEWDGRIINLPQIEIMKIYEDTPDYIIITISLYVYKEEFD